jgi:cation:H+ antiporter
MLDAAQWDLEISAAVFVVSAAAISIAGTLLTARADRLADRTGLGEAVAGAVLLGAATSLSGIVTSATAAWGGHPQLSVSNALGGIAAQTLFLTIADVAYREANLEHAAASAANIMQGTLLITLLAFILVGMTTPGVTLWSVHPATALLLLAYPYGLYMVQRAQRTPSWKPQQTRETVEDEPEETPAGESVSKLWLQFSGLALLVAIAGYFLEKSAVGIAARTQLTQSVIGAMLTAIVSSLPELVTSVAAVRRGALTLAVGGIIGGNAFDTLFVAVSDIAYRNGSIYHAAGEQEIMLLSLTILMTGFLLMGLIRRQTRGIANIGFESFLIVVFYLGGMALLWLN